MRVTLTCILLCLAGLTFSQTPIQVYQKWSADNPTVRPYLFFNQPQYSPGDTVWFKAYMFENGNALKGSFLLNVTVVNDHARPVAQTLFRVKDGASNCQLVLPDSLQSGVYRFFAHNQWMNGNPASSPAWKDIVVTSRQNVVPTKSTDTSVKFFPEGGSLINSIANRVVVTMSGNIDSCRLYRNNKDVVTTFKVVNGFGSFHFTPQKGNTYSIGAGQERYALPPATDDGVSVLVTRRTANMRVLIAAPEESVYRNGPLYILMTINGVLYLSQELSFGDLEFMQFGVPLASLPAGIARLSVLNDSHEIVAERKFLVDYNKAPQVVLKTKQEVVKSRERVEVEVQLLDETGAPMEGEFAASVTNQKLFLEDPALNFRDDLLTPVNKSFSIDRSRADWLEYTDRILIASPRDTAHWSEVFSSVPIDRPTGRYSRFAFKAIDRATGKPLPDQTRMLIYLQSNANSYEGRIANGELELVLPGDFWGVDDFYFLAETEKGYKDDVEVTLQHEDLNFTPASQSRLTDEANLYASFNSKVKMMDRSYGFFTRKTGVVTSNSNSNFSIEDELNGADVTVDLQKFISFPNMDEVLREVVPGLTHRKSGNKSLVRVDLINTDLIPKSDPLYVIDGLMTMNTSYFLNLKPDDIMTIKVVRDYDKLNRLGGVGRNGVVIVQTLKPNPKALKATGSYITMQGISSPATFHPTQHSPGMRSKVPDFRSTLYWNPSIRAGKDGKAVITFSASDDVGPVSIKVLGTTLQGTPFSGQTEVDVTFNDLNK